MNKIADQIQHNFIKAFKHSIDENIVSNTPDFDWIMSLLIEIKERLKALLTNEQKRMEIDKEYDVEFIHQLIVNKVFDKVSMDSLIEITFKWLFRLQAPYRDKMVNVEKLRLLQIDDHTIVSEFCLTVNKIIDDIIEDLQNLNDVVNR